MSSEEGEVAAFESGVTSHEEDLESLEGSDSEGIEGGDADCSDCAREEREKGMEA